MVPQYGRGVSLRGGVVSTVTQFSRGHPAPSTTWPDASWWERPPHGNGATPRAPGTPRCGGWTPDVACLRRLATYGCARLALDGNPGQFDRYPAPRPVDRGAAPACAVHERVG